MKPPTIDFLAPITRHCVAPAWAAWERSPYLRHYRRLLARINDPPEAICLRQWERIDRIVRHAYQTVPFWQRGSSRPAWTSIGRLGRAVLRVPLLHRSDIQVHQSEMLSSLYRGAAGRRKTSGSTGEAVEVLVDDEAQQFKRACTLRSDEWSGWRLGERVAALWGDPGTAARLAGAAAQRAVGPSSCLDTLKMDEVAMAEFAAPWWQRPPSLLMGHAHSLYLLAQFSAPATSPKASALGPSSRPAWSCTTGNAGRSKPFPVSGHQPLRLRGGEPDRLRVRQHQGLHVNSDGVYVEVLRPDGGLRRRRSGHDRGHRPGQPGDADDPLSGGRYGSAERPPVPLRARAAAAGKDRGRVSPTTWSRPTGSGSPAFRSPRTSRPGARNRPNADRPGRRRSLRISDCARPRFRSGEPKHPPTAGGRAVRPHRPLHL